MSHDASQITLRDHRPGRAQPGDAVTLQPAGAQQASDSITLVERTWPQPATADAILLVVPAAPADVEPPDFAPTSRPTAAAYGIPWAGTDRHLRRPVRGRWTAVHRMRPSARLPYARGDRRRHDWRLPWSQNERLRAQHRVPWPGDQAPLPASVTVPWGSLERQRRQYRATWPGEIESLGRTIRVPYDHPPRKQRLTRAPWRDVAEQIAPTLRLPYLHPPRKQGRWRLPWGYHRDPLEWGFHPPPPEPPDEPEPPTFEPQPGDDVQLNFKCPLHERQPGTVDLWLGFECPPPPARRVTIVQNEMSILRASDDATIHCDQVQLSTDIDSYTWDVRGRVLGQPSLQKLEHDSAGPRELVVTLNGLEWRVLAEDYNVDRRWERTERSFAGRGIAAALAGPYAGTTSGEQTSDRNAQQLANDALDFTGWSLIWDVPDWLVPAGVYTWQDQTPIERIARIARAAGAVVAADPDAETLRVISRYPVSPWDWDTATPDVTVPAHLVRRLGSHWEPQPGHTRVFVAGREGGVLVRVTRDGTAGDQLALQVVDELVTHVDAGRERGRVELSGSGDSARVTIELPLATGAGEPGLILPGHLVEIADGQDTWRGLATATSITATRQSIQQQIEIERRFTS